MRYYKHHRLYQLDLDDNATNEQLFSNPRINRKAFAKKNASVETEDNPLFVRARRIRDVSDMGARFFVFVLIGKLKPETIQAIVDEMAKKGEEGEH